VGGGSRARDRTQHWWPGAVLRNTNYWRGRAKPVPERGCAGKEKNVVVLKGGSRDNRETWLTGEKKPGQMRRTGKAEETKSMLELVRTTNERTRETMPRTPKNVEKTKNKQKRQKIPEKPFLGAKVNTCAPKKNTRRTQCWGGKNSPRRLTPRGR